MIAVDAPAITPSEPLFNPGRLKALGSALGRQLHIRARLFRRATVVRIRNVFRLEEDIIRDRLVDGLRRDLDRTTSALAQAVQGLNTLHARLEYHEAKIPRMRALRTEFDEGKRAEKKAREKEVEEAVKEMTETTERRALGLLT